MSCYATTIRRSAAALSAAFLCLVLTVAAAAAPLIDAPPLGERWFVIQMDTDQVGFYRQVTSALPEGGYRIEGDGSVRMQVMGFTKESSSREVYLLTPALALKSFEVEQTISGQRSRLTGKAVSEGLLVRRESNGKQTERMLKTRREIIPGPALNLYPLLKDVAGGKLYRVTTFDPEEMKLKEVKITLLGAEPTPDGQAAFKMRNNLYPFVDNDIWVDRQGNTLYESVRSGLVVTRAEQPEKLAAVVSGIALSKKDLIFDFSLVRVEPELKLPPARLSGLSVAIDGYGAALPLLADGWQATRRSADRLTISTGSLRPAVAAGAAVPEMRYLAAAEGIESGAPVIISKARELATGRSGAAEQAKALAGWTSRWVEDSVEDSGTALAAFQKKSGNCQSHAKLYVALARALGIPSRFVSGLVTRDGKGFIYHSWAESWIEGRWVAVDPTFDQLPADPTHLALFEGHQAADLAPLVGVIGKIKVTVLEER